MRTVFDPIRQLTLAVLTGLACASSVLAAPPTASAQARYQHELAVCNSGQSNQDPATCRREAASARAEALRGALNGDPAQYSTNALRRCDSHQGDDRDACEARILDQGDTSRETQAGGILRESITVTPGAAN